MNISLLIGLVFLVASPSQIPNYYRTYPSAKAEAAKSQKDLLIFFTSAGCEKCNSAWNAYTADVNAVSRYISTQVLTNSFDGQILFENFEPGNTPSWVVVNTKGEIIEKWEGGWKDATGKGTLFSEVIDSKPDVVKSNSTPLATSSKSGKETPNPVLNATVVTKPSNEKPISAEPIKEKPITPTPSVPAATATKGFVVQAGYFGSSTNADRCLNDLKAKGFSNFNIQPVESNGTTFYRVWSIVFGTEAEAQSNLKKLTTLGLTATVKACP